jgi:hypothetical protein
MSPHRDPVRWDVLAERSRQRALTYRHCAHLSDMRGERELVDVELRLAVIEERLVEVKMALSGYESQMMIRGDEDDYDDAMATSLAELDRPAATAGADGAGDDGAAADGVPE